MAGLDAWLDSVPVTLCGTCGLPVTRATKSARRSPTGWSHARFGGWEGMRCPGRITGAVPGEVTTFGEWRDRQERNPIA